MVTWYVSWCSLFLPFWGGPRTACTLKLCEAFCFTRSRSKSNSVTSTVTSQVLCGFYAYIEIDIDIDRCIIINIWLVVYLPLWKILVNWDDYSQYMESHKIHVPDHLPVYTYYTLYNHIYNQTTNQRITWNHRVFNPVTIASSLAWDAQITSAGWGLPVAGAA